MGKSGLKLMSQKRPAKDERERLVLLGLVELYLETGKPVGSTTLMENGFQSLSSATIRNYFAKLEKKGFLRQQHSSGGRIPTELAYKLYAEHTQPEIDPEAKARIQEALREPTREVASYLQRASDLISDETNCATILSSPRFDQDFVIDVKLIAIDADRCLCVLLTDFGMVRTELLSLDAELSEKSLQKISKYLQWRITGEDKPVLNHEEQRIATRFYKEIMLRQIVANSNFSFEDLYKTGFSKLLAYPDFNNAAALASGLSLFENKADLAALLKKGSEGGELTCFLGEDLDFLTTELSGCSLIVIPYRIHQNIAGAIALLGPNRLPYSNLFGILKTAAEAISETLTASLYTYKITYRTPAPAKIGQVDQASALLLGRDE